MKRVHKSVEAPRNLGGANPPVFLSPLPEPTVNISFITDEESLRSKVWTPKCFLSLVWITKSPLHDGYNRDEVSFMFL